MNCFKDIKSERMENVMKKVVFTTGGTGGHIYPAISIADKMREKNIDILFIGTEHRMEKDLVPKKNFRFIGLDVLPLNSPKSIIKMIIAIFRAISILKKEKPTEIIGFGNYITIPVLTAAMILRIPYYLQEQNSTMGMANRYFYKKAKKVFIAFGNTLDLIDQKYKSKFITTGNPLREEFYTKNSEEERNRLGIKENEKVILVMGGSLGAKSINDAIVKKWNDLLKEKNLKLFWATGKDNYEDVSGKLKDVGNNVVVPYFDNAANLMAASDLVMCRAGASTVSELIQMSKPSILIPYDFVGQKENADVLEFVNAAKIFSNEEADNAVEEALSLIKQTDMLMFMKENIERLKKGNAAELIIKEMGL